jgi:type I restriction enzyme S subunit
MRPTDALPHPDDWQTATVAQAIEMKRGISWSKDQENSTPRTGAVPIIRIGNVQGSLQLDDLLYISGLKPGAVEQTKVGEGWSLIVGSNGNRNRVGNAVFIRERVEYLFASFLIAARPYTGSGVSSEFFYRWLTSEPIQAHLSASAEGTTGLNNLSHSFFRAMEIAFPPLDEQAAIARVLDAVVTAIERTRVAVKRARDLNRAVLQDFFVRAVGETAYADRPSKDLPHGWELVPTELLLSDEPKNGISPKAASQPPGIPTFSIAAIRHGKVALHSGEHIKYAQIPDTIADAYRVARGDVLVVRGNANPELVGNAGMVDFFPEGCIYPDIAKRIVFRVDGGRVVSPEYAVLVWNHPIVHNQILRRAKTSNGTLKINNRDVKQTVLPVPPPAEQTQIVKLTEAVDRKVESLTTVAGAYEQLKRSLMHDLLTGKVRVNSLDVDKVLIP